MLYSELVSTVVQFFINLATCLDCELILPLDSVTW